MGCTRSPQAERDLSDIWTYVAVESDSVEAADRLIDAITARFILIAQFPHVGRSREELRHGLRSFPVGEYIVFYRVTQDDVVILRVLRGSRDIPEFF